MSYKILVADDDVMTVNLVKAYLEQEHCRVLVAYDGRRALELAREKQPDLVVLDLMLPRVDGLDVCRILRSTSDIPIIMLTAKSTEDDVLLGLDLGADDYVTKPFSPRELVARIRTVLRRSRLDGQGDVPEELHFGELSIYSSRHEVLRGGETVPLTPREFKLLYTMAREPGRAFSRHQLLESAFGVDSDSLERTVDYHIMNLRRKIEHDDSATIYIQTVFGVGYKFSSGPYPTATS
jgi:DNA-binding response OmpR family regulator